jgi:hypothetical protein
MATPKGLRAIKLPVNGSDAVHVYSDDHRIWLQLRRFVPTERDIGRPSFKAALNLTPDTARKLGLELLNAAERSKAKTPPAKKPSPATKHAPARAKQI